MTETFEDQLARVRSMVTHVMSVPPLSKDRDALRAVLAQYDRLREEVETLRDDVEMNHDA